MQPLIIDVRERLEFLLYHVEGATNIPVNKFKAGKLPSHLGDVKKSQPIIVYCASGGRAEKVAKALRDHGFTNVINGINKRGVKGLLSD